MQEEQSQKSESGSSELDTGPAKIAWEDFKSQIPQEIRDSPVIQNVKTIGDMADQFVNVNKLIGKDKVIFPGESSSEEEWGEFYKKTGRPDKDTDYGITTPEGYNPEAGMGADQLKRIQADFFKAGLSKKQAAAIASSLFDQSKERYEEGVKEGTIEGELWKKEIKEHYGVNMDSSMAIGQRGLDWAGDEVKKFLKDYGLKGHPTMIKLMGRIGDFQGDHQINTDSPGSTGMTPETANNEINRLMGDSDFLTQYTDKRNPQYGSAQKKLSKLYSLATPSR